MNFVVQFLSEIGGNAKPDAIRTINFESDDLYLVVSRTRIILSSRDYEPTVTAFQIMTDAQVIYHEHRQEPDACRPVVNHAATPQALSPY